MCSFIEMGYNRTTYQEGHGFKCWVLFLIFVVTFASLGQEQSYVVKPKDTLSGIAQSKGFSVKEIADHNGISRTSQINVGQKLLVPGKKGDPKPTASLPDSAVNKAIKNAPVKSSRWKTIVIHHAAVDEGNVKALDRYHREQRHMENGLAYHFLIGNGNGMRDGEIAVGNRWKKQLDGGHLHSVAQNKTALGICLIGDFDKHPPTTKQLRSLEHLIRALMQRCKLSGSAVKTHQQINVVHTECPGSKFPTRTFLARLKKPAQ